MDIGKLRHRIAILTPTLGTEADSTPEETMSAGSTVWGSIMPTAGLERFSEANVNGEVTHQITVRHTTEITRKSRLTNDSRTFEVVSLINPGERDKMLIILAKEEV